MSRDVIFEEEKQWYWDESYEEHILVDLEWGDDDAVGVNDNKSKGGENNTGVENDGDREGDVSPNNGDIEDNEGGKRMREPLGWMRDYVSGEDPGLSEDEGNLALMESNDPLYYEEAVKDASWRLAMDNEIKSIEKNKTSMLVSLPIGAKKIGVKWIYKTKYNEHEEFEQHKARLVAKGYTHKHGIDYTQVYALVARMVTVRMVMALAAQRNWKIFQLDVKSAFLHGELNEDVYVEQPRGYEIKGSEDKVYKLHKALYGLKQAPRAWFSPMETYFVNERFERDLNEHTLFTKRSKEGKILIVSVYVDDLIYIGDDEKMMSSFKCSMMQVFEMTNLGKMNFFLNIELLQQPNGIFIYQRKYALEVLKRFGMLKSHEVNSLIVPGSKLSKDVDGVAIDESYYKQIVGSLMYLTTTRPDIMYSVNLINRYMAMLTELRLQAAKRILRYLKSNFDYGIMYKKGSSNDLVAYTDSDYADDIDDRKSTSGYVFLFCYGAVSMLSKKQLIVTISTTEAEFVAAAGCASQVVWTRRVLE